MHCSAAADPKLYSFYITPPRSGHHLSPSYLQSARDGPGRAQISSKTSFLCIKEAGRPHYFLYSNLFLPFLTTKLHNMSPTAICMFSAVFQPGNDDLVLESHHPIAQPQEGEVLLKVAAAGGMKMLDASFLCPV